MATAGPSVDSFILTARERWRTVEAAERELRAKQLEDLQFAAGEQWDRNLLKAREADGRPSLTIDRLSGPIKQVTNQQRQSKPAIQINPVDDGADPDTAEVLQGLIRRVELNSDADTVYQWACDHQVKAGRGFWRVIAEYAGDDTFEQELRIARIRNQFTVYMDPSGERPDGSDARFCFIVEDLSRDEFARRYPKKRAITLGDLASIGDCPPDWITEERIRIAEYYYVEDQPVTLRLLSNGGVILDGDPLPKGASVRATRTVSKRRVKWCVINAIEHLEEPRDIPGPYIPVVQLLGEEWFIDGKIDYRGMVRMAKDPQRMTNYWKSAMTEAVALAPKAPWVGAEGQFEGHPEWDLANIKNYSKLEYKPTTIAGSLAPPPQRNVAEPPIQAMAILSQQNENDLRAVTGFFDVQGAEQRPEQSGKAILARQRQGETGNSHFLDNLGLAIRHTGRILLAQIPTIYDTPRVLRILGLDEQPKTVMVGKQENAPQALPPGIEKLHDPTLGRYDVTVTVGPSYQSRRQEAVEAMAMVFQANPNVFPLIGDLWVASQDWPGAKAVSERLKKMLPPQLQDNEQSPEMQLQQLQQQMQQASQMLQIMQQELEAKTRLIETDTIKAQQALERERLKIEADKEIEFARINADLTKTQAQIDANGALVVLKQQMAEMQAQLQFAQQSQLQAGQQAHDAAMAGADQQFQGQQADADRQMAMQQAAQAAQEQTA